MVSKTLDEWLTTIEAIHPKSIDMGLERIRAVYAALGSPRPARYVITVAGTNGKGSTVAFLESIAQCETWRVGAYTSPHLLRFNERIRIQGSEVADADLVSAFERIDAARGTTPLTYFEFATLAALLLFADAKLDLAILEVGLGGRLDATNLIDSDVAVITTVDLDHQDYLGADRELIGAEKAGVMRAWKPVVLGDEDPPSSVLGRAYRLGASAIRYRCDFFVDVEPAADHWIWREPGTQFAVPMPQLQAPVQIRNAAVAIAAMRALPNSPKRASLQQGIANATVSGRLQNVAFEGHSITVDVAHNPQAAGELSAWLRAHPIPGRNVAVFAGLADKDRAGVLDRLADDIAQWELAPLPGPRGEALPQLQQALSGHRALSGVCWHSDVLSAVRHAIATSKTDDRIVVFGSFLSVAAVLQAAS